MNLSRFFIDRPIFAGVLSVLILLGGAISLGLLPIAEYPEVVPPSVVVRARPHRRLSGRVFIAITRALGVRQVVDTQCGFKLFRGGVADDLFGALGTEGFAFDVELILRAERRGYRIAEVPVNWTDQPGSKVGVLKDGPRMLAEIVAARLRIARDARGARG